MVLLQGEKATKSGQRSVGGAIFRPWFDLGTQSTVRVSVRASRMKLTSDSLSTHAAREGAGVEAASSG